jgi:hypothetical protein
VTHSSDPRDEPSLVTQGQSAIHSMSQTIFHQQTSLVAQQEEYRAHTFMWNSKVARSRLAQAIRFFLPFDTNNPDRGFYGYTIIESTVSKQYNTELLSIKSIHNRIWRINSDKAPKFQSYD